MANFSSHHIEAPQEILKTYMSTPKLVAEQETAGLLIMVFQAAPILVALFCLWDIFEYWLSQRNRKRYRDFPLPPPHERNFDVSNVSIIIPTVDTVQSFPDSLSGLLANKPLEIIIVTIKKKEELVKALIHAPGVQAVRGNTDIKVLSISTPNKRDQLVHGINQSRGDIIALVDDDAFWESVNVLLHLLAPFQERDIGLVGGPITSYLPPARKNPAIITPWEVAAMRLRGKRHESMKAAHAADGGINFCVSGVTMLLRAEILLDPVFQYAFTNDVWMGLRQNTGDDTFITRWILFGHLYGSPQWQDDGMQKQWRIGMQLTQEAEVGTSIMSNARFVGQVKRWYRSGLRHRLMCLFYEPGFRGMWRTCPLMTRKMVEGMLNPVLIWIRIACLWKTFVTWQWTWFATLVFAYYVYNYANGFRDFFKQHPWARGHWMAAIIVDQIYLISDWYCWFTLGTEAWITRHTVDDDHDYSINDSIEWKRN